MRTSSLRARVVVREKEPTKISIPQCQVVARAKSKINQEMGEKVCGCNLEVGGGGPHGAGGGGPQWGYLVVVADRPQYLDQHLAQNGTQ